MLFGAILGGELGLFFVGLIYLLKGEAKLSNTKTVKGVQIRIGSLILISPMLLIILLSLNSASSAPSAIAAFAANMTSWQGIILSGVGMVIGYIIIYRAPTA